MQLLKPSQISGEIMTLIEEADEKLILVSPYCKVSKWYKLLNKIEAFKRRKITVEFYVRQGETDSVAEVRALGITPIEIPHLHAKLYLNEKYGIVSSMNLLHSSDNNSLDIAYKTTTEQEYQELLGYYQRYLKSAAAPEIAETPNTVLPVGFDWRKYLFDKLAETTGYEPWINESENYLQVRSNNTYEATVVDGQQRVLQITGIVTQREFEELQKRSRSLWFGKGLEISLVAKKGGGYNMVQATTQQILASTSVNNPAPAEQLLLADAIAEFVSRVEEWKRNLYARKR